MNKLAGSLLCGVVILILCNTCVLAQQSSAPMPSVVVASVKTKDVTPNFSYVGRVEAVDKVDLRARVEGYLAERNFREGRLVKMNDVLFIIDKAPYQVVVEQRQADLAGAQANLKNAQADLVRKQGLREQRVLSQAELDTAVANEAVAQANVLQAQAALKSAELDLSYTDIRSPIDGQISRARYSIGNLISTGSDPLATVTSLDPVYVVIAISEKDLIEARRQGINLENPPVAPYLTLSDGSEYEHSGYFDYLDTAVNQSTDTITARAVFPNSERVLLPGQFVNVIVRQKEAVSALVVPQAAVQRDQQGYFVLVVNQADTVEVRRIEIGDQVDSEWIVHQGLVSDEQVIVQGIQKVRPDMSVKPVRSEG